MYNMSLYKKVYNDNKLIIHHLVYQKYTFSLNDVQYEYNEISLYSI